MDELLDVDAGLASLLRQKIELLARFLGEEVDDPDQAGRLELELVSTKSWLAQHEAFRALRNEDDGQEAMIEALEEGLSELPPDQGQRLRQLSWLGVAFVARAWAEVKAAGALDKGLDTLVEQIRARLPDEGNGPPPGALTMAVSVPSMEGPRDLDSHGPTDISGILGLEVIDEPRTASCGDTRGQYK